MEKLSINACPVCGGAHLKRVMTCTDFYASGEQFELYSCEDCGFTFTQGVPVEAEIGKYYETPDYISHTDTRKGAMNNIYHYVRSYMLGRKARLVAKEAHRKTGRLLDIGTGTGYFSDAMVRRGWKVEAVEKSPQAREFAKLHFDLDVKPESALKEFAPGSFDVITLWHVMEHLEHLDEVWQRLHELLTEKGVLIVAVPNCSSYDAQRYGEYWAAYDVPRHLWHFTPGTIQQLASPSWLYYGGASSDAVRCVLRIHVERKTSWQFMQFPERDVCRDVGLVQCFGKERTQQFNDLCIPKKEITHGKSKQI